MCGAASVSNGRRGARSRRTLWLLCAVLAGAQGVHAQHPGGRQGDAHEAVALAVRHAEHKSCDLSDLALEELKQFSDLVAEDIYAVLTLEGSLAARNHTGGTAPLQVTAAIAQARKTIAV